MDETDVFVDVHRRILVARAKRGRRQSVSICEGAARSARHNVAARHVIRRAKSNQSDQVAPVRKHNSFCRWQTLDREEKPWLLFCCDRRNFACTVNSCFCVSLVWHCISL